jgi:hypothetical protein
VPPSEPKRGRAWLAAGVAALLVVAVGGGAWAFNALRSKGPQPEEVLPADAVAYVRMDLDPSADQKLNALRFFKKFPEVDKKLGDEEEDLRKTLWEAIASEDDDLKDLDYATDIEPWLGNRAAMAAVPAGDSGTEPVAVLHITDQEKAEEAVKKIRSEDDDTGVAFTDDYMVIADTQQIADDVVKAAAEKPLAENEDFRADMAALDSTGVLSFWADAKELANEVGDESMGQLGAASTQFDGRVVGALSFESNYAQLEARLRGGQIPEVQDKGIKLGELPESTVVGLSVAGAGASLEQNWSMVESALRASAGDQYNAVIDAARQQFGIELPGDLVTILGKEFTIALDEEGLADAVQGRASALPKVGFRSTPADVDQAKDVLDKVTNLLSAAGAPFQLGTATSSDAVALATSESYAQALVEEGGLSDTDAFRQVVANTENAQFGLFVDIDKLEQLAPSSMSNRDVIEPLKAVGMSGYTTDDGAAFTLRVLVN